MVETINGPLFREKRVYLRISTFPTPVYSALELGGDRKDPRTNNVRGRWPSLKPSMWIYAATATQT